MSEAVVREWDWIEGGDYPRYMAGTIEIPLGTARIEHNAVVAALRAALANAAQLRKALKKFGHHDSICTQWSHFSGASIRDPHARCSCGLSAAVKAPREGEKEREP